MGQISCMANPDFSAILILIPNSLFENIRNLIIRNSLRFRWSVTSYYIQPMVSSFHNSNTKNNNHKKKRCNVLSSSCGLTAHVIQTVNRFWLGSRLMLGSVFDSCVGSSPWLRSLKLVHVWVSLLLWSAFLVKVNSWSLTSSCITYNKHASFQYITC